MDEQHINNPSDMNPTEDNIIDSNITNQTNNNLISSNINKIKQIEEEFTIRKPHSQSVTTLVLTQDNRIASGSLDGSISICSFNLNEKTWNRDIHQPLAHINWICTLCMLRDNKLISGGIDSKLQIWNITNNEIQIIKILTNHSKTINSIINLSQGRFASCSDDKTIRIWDDINYQQIAIIEFDIDLIRSMVQPKGKEILVSCGYTTWITFWSLTTYVNIKSIKEYCVSRPTYMIGLHDGNIALCSKCDHESIIIISSSSYEEIKRIKMENYIKKPSSLCIFNDYSFIYVSRGTVLQIESSDYEIVFKSKGSKFDGWYGGVILIEQEKYFITTSGFDLTIFKIDYE